MISKRGEEKEEKGDNQGEKELDVRREKDVVTPESDLIDKSSKTKIASKLDENDATEQIKDTQEKETKEIVEEVEVPEFVEKVISINRVTKVTKGGKKLSFSALVVVGDTKGKVGYSLSKAPEVATASRKAMTIAKKSMIKVPMKGTTITHEIIGGCGGARVLLKPASEGTGVIASGPVRAICEGAGIYNILTKSHRSNNPINVVKATIDGLSRLKINDALSELKGSNAITGVKSTTEE